MIFRTLRTSRGYGKFVRNRAAMIALAVITGYFILAAWIIAIELVQWVGNEGATWLNKQTGAASAPAAGSGAPSAGVSWWNLYDNPVLGLLSAPSAERRVGPKWVSGLGLRSTLARREDHVYAVFDQLDRALKVIESKPDATDDTVREVIARDEFRFAERVIVARPLPELKALRDKAKGALDGLLGLKRTRDQLVKVTSALAAIDEKHRLLESLPPTAEAQARATLTDDLGAAVAELGFTLEDYAKLPPLPTRDGEPADPMRAIDTLAIDDAANAIRDNTAKSPPAPVVLPAEAIAQARAALPVVRAAIDAPLASALDAIEPITLEIMPRPAGLKGVLYDFRLLLGTNASGQSNLVRALYSAKIAIQVGCIVALAAVLLGAMLGSAAGYFGGMVDHLVTWLYSTLSALPQLVLLGVMSFLFLNSQFEKTLIPVYFALTATFWIGTCRVVRGEVLKLKELEYVQAGKAIGFGRVYILLRHVLPNTTHLLFINFSLLFIGAVKSEVILTYLGLGIKDGASWGRMISASGDEVIGAGIFWQIGAATFFMLALVLAFNILSDALQDAFDPKHVG